GRLDDLHKTGPAMPKLIRGSPSVPAKDFVQRAKTADGATIEPRGPETFEVRIPGRTKELITFDEGLALAADGRGVFMGNARRLYLPGKPAFERLTQHWVDRAGHHVRDLEPQDASRAERLASDWCARLPDAQFQRAVFRPRQPGFRGVAIIKAKTANAVDSYEK